MGEKRRVYFVNKTRLVLFYSWSGNTRRAARLLAERAGADLVELEPVSPYPADYAQTVRQAGREIRVMVKPEQVSEDDMVILARELAKRIESELEYPGQIKVHVLRETKVIEYAK